MRRIFVVFLLMIVLAACSGETEVAETDSTQETAPTEEVATEPTEEPTPTLAPTEESTPTGEPTPDLSGVLADVELEPYAHPSGAFSFDVPVGWDVIDESPTSVAFGVEEFETIVRAAYTQTDDEISDERFQAFIDNFIDNLFENISDEHEVLNQELQPDGSTLVEASFSSSDVDGFASLFFERRESLIYVFYFVSSHYEEAFPLWQEMVNSYTVTPEAVLVAETPTLSDTPYVHPSGAISFLPPDNWQVIFEDETSATLASSDGESAIGTLFINPGQTLTEQRLQEFIDFAVGTFLSPFGQYQITSQEAREDDSILVEAEFGGPTVQGDADFIIGQEETVVYVFYLVSSRYADLQPVWQESITSFDLDANIAAEALPPSSPDDTVGSVPTVEPDGSYEPPEGRVRVFLRNNFIEEVFFDVGGQGQMVAPGGFEFVDLDAGQYTWTVSVPGAAGNGEIDAGPTQSWIIAVDENGNIAQGQVYP